MAEANRCLTARANRAWSAVARHLIKLDAQLRRPLKDVEELSKRQEEQRRDDGDRVNDREESCTPCRAATPAKPSAPCR